MSLPEPEAQASHGSVWSEAQNAPVRRRAGWLAALPVAVAVAFGAASAAGSAWARAPLDPQDRPPDPPASGHLSRPEPGQMHGSVPPPLTGVSPFQRVPAIDESSWLVVTRRARPYWEAGTLDPVLTNACRRGEFATLPINRLVVTFSGDPDSGEGGGALQVVPPAYRHLLVDQRRLAKEGETYFFHHAGEPECQVWIEGKVKPRKLSAAGTSLPPADPQAKKKRQALIKSWPAPPPVK